MVGGGGGGVMLPVKSSTNLTIIQQRPQRSEQRSPAHGRTAGGRIERAKNRGDKKEKKETRQDKDGVLQETPAHADAAFKTNSLFL